ncbi:MAG: hypothetical protein OEV44_06980 [Spirochaetota bacterium]|nr:hypothetical protein [Spirochaetota bacterium]
MKKKLLFFILFSLAFYTLINCGSILELMADDIKKPAPQSNNKPNTISPAELQLHEDVKPTMKLVKTDLYVNALFNDKHRTDRPRRPDRSDRLEGDISSKSAKTKVNNNEITNIIKKIKAGNQDVIKKIDFYTFEAVHDAIVQQSNGNNYYKVIGMEKSLPAFIAGFDNQDPKVRLKCIGYLGDWIEDVGKSITLIERAVYKRYTTNIETRKEVRYAYRLLRMKCIRKRTILSILNGKKVLETISPDNFIPLVFYEPRIRAIYLGSPPESVSIGSIALDSGIDQVTGDNIGNNPGRAKENNLEQVCYSGNGNENNNNLNWNCVRAIFSGLNNHSMFVREHSVRIFLNYIRGLTGDPNYIGNTSHSTRKLHNELNKMAKDVYYVRLAQVAWDNVKWCEFYYNDNVVSNKSISKFAKQRNYLEHQSVHDNSDYTPSKTKRYFTNDVKSYPEWGTEHTGNYRNDIKEILRILGMSWYFDSEYVSENGNPENENIITSFTEVQQWLGKQ